MVEVCCANATVNYSNNINAGTASVTVTGQGNYTGTLTASFYINKCRLGEVTLAQTEYTYDGTAKEPGAEVKSAAGAVLTPGTDYTISYTDNAAAGTATAPS